MRKIFAAVLISVVAAVAAGCALNPFAEDNIYNRKNTETTSDAPQRTADMTKADSHNADADRNGVISKQEGERISGLAAFFDRHEPDRDGTLAMQKSNAAMNGMNASRR